MTNSQLKTIIERDQNVRIKVSHYLCNGTWEGFATTEALFCGQYKTILESQTCGSRTRIDSTTSVLLRVASELAADLPEAAYQIIARRNAADFFARTGFAVPFRK